MCKNGNIIRGGEVAYVQGGIKSVSEVRCKLRQNVYGRRGRRSGCGERRERESESVIALLDVEAMRLDGAEAFNPELLSAETDSVWAGT